MKSFWRTLGRTLRKVLFAWVVIAFATLMAGLVISEMGSPRWLPLPWSDLTDFVETSDGRVFVSIGFFGRILAYDKDGEFLGSFHYPPTKPGARLNVDDNDRVYFRAAGKIFALDNDLEPRQVAELIGCTEWTLADTRELVCTSMERDKLNEPTTTPVKAGERVFASNLAPRKFFTGKDGSTLRRGWTRLVRFSPQGEKEASFGTPWYLWLLQSPFPTLPLIFVFFIYLFVEERLEKRDRRK